MVAFEISVNGHHIRTITSGECGMLNVDVMWAKIERQDGTVHEEFTARPSGLEGTDGDAVSWPGASLNMGDSVTIRMVNVETTGDTPSERVPRAELLTKRP
jgi:hypothetical protein